MYGRRTTGYPWYFFFNFSKKSITNNNLRTPGESETVKYKHDASTSECVFENRVQKNKHNNILTM